MVFKYSFYIACIMCGAGLMYRIGCWYSRQLSPAAENYPVRRRIGSTLAGVLRTLSGPRIFKLVYALAADVLLQLRILFQNPFRWIMHFSIFAGFMLLLCMHALEDEISRNVFGNYESTLNPFMFLRNLFGLMVLAGLVMAISRRYADRRLRRITGGADKFALLLLSVIMISGFFLEAAKIISSGVFTEMVETYAGMYDDPEGTAPLKAYWAREYGVAFPGQTLDFSAELMAEGALMSEDSCAFCHARPEWAFLSYPVSRAMVPFAGVFDRIRMDRVLWYVHFLVCFAGLALLPFTKFFHIISTPVTLMIHGASDPEKMRPVNAATRRVIDMDGCTHCGACTLHCSVAPTLNYIDNVNILPSERLAALKGIAAGRKAEPQAMAAIAEGGFICTSCYRCTRLCPSGLNLQDIWLAAREKLSDMGYPAPDQGAVLKSVKKRAGDRNLVTLSVRRQDFSECLKCMTCTNSCPVVACYDNPAEILGMVPHQIMHALSMGLDDLAVTAPMIWACTTCYLCQEHCPQRIKIMDIFYGLKNLAYQQSRMEMAGTAGSRAG